jgi:hypothetical protein
VAEDAVEDEGLDLFLRGAELVEGVVDLVVEDLVLDGDGDLDKDVVVGLGLDGKLRLLDLEVDEVDALGEGDEDVKAGTDDAVELAEAFDNARRIGADGEEGFEDGDENDDGKEDEEDQQGSVQRFHRCGYLCKRGYMRRVGLRGESARVTEQEVYDSGTPVCLTKWPTFYGWAKGDWISSY